MSNIALTNIQRYRGALLGLACGDAIGTTLEFTQPGSFEPIDDMVGGGPFNLQPGEWTDDTSMALCLAESLVEKGGFDPRDQIERYVRWYREGYLSSTGRCFDIGNTTRQALHHFEQTGAPYSGSTSPRSGGNGSIMRLAPAPMAYASQPEKALRYAGDSSRPTHGAPEAVDACRYLAGLIVGALNGASKEDLLAPAYCPLPDAWRSQPLSSKIAEVAAGSFKHLNPPKETVDLAASLGFRPKPAVIQGSGYVVKSLEAALWAFYHSRSFKEGCLLAVNLGDDADTTGAVYGQLAGAFYGQDNIPVSWRNRLAMRELIEALADKLLTLNGRKPA